MVARWVRESTIGLGQVGAELLNDELNHQRVFLCISNSSSRVIAFLTALTSCYAFIQFSKPKTLSVRSEIDILRMSSRGNLSFVQVWLDTVANETKPTKSTNLRPRRSRAHDQSQPLAPTSHNPRFPTRASKQLASRINPARACKNKRWKSMAGDQDGSYMDDEDTKVPAHRGRGRPRGRPATPAARTAVRGRGRGGGQAENAAVMPNATPSTFFDAPDLASQSRSPSRQPSPGKSASSKGRSKTFEAIKADSAIDMMYLENCTPSVHLMSLQEARKSGHVPESVMEMNLSLTDTPGYIPSSLKVSH